MEKFQLTILGCGSALPTLRHYPSSQVLNIREKLFMIDCGEGSQQQLRRYHLKFSRLNHIFISHLHGDHCFGIIGLISTFNLLGRTNKLSVYGPKGIEEFLRPQIRFFCPNLAFEVEICVVSTKESTLVYEDRTVTVRSLPLRHRLPTTGYIFEEKAPLPHIKRDMIDFYRIPFYAINHIKNGEDWTTEEGKVIPNHLLVTPSAPGRTYVYCSDTSFLPDNARYATGANLIYHEATFAAAAAARAAETGHSTAAQAAEFARLSAARRLIIGHFSARYDDESALLEEAQALFPDTLLAHEGLVIDIE